MKKMLMLLSLSLLFVGCDRMDRAQSHDADNTARNARDRDGATKTSGDQAENENDRTITQRIRQAIMDDDSLSTNAKNIKIITINGVTTLRGPVNTSEERSVIEGKVRRIQGVNRIENQLEVVREK